MKTKKIKGEWKVNPSYRIALVPSQILENPVADVPTVYVEYSYREGLLDFFKIFAVVIVLALIGTIFAYIIGIRKRDICSVLVTNIMLKTIAVGILKILECLYLENTFIILALAIVAIISEGLIYNKILKYKKHK